MSEEHLSRLELLSYQAGDLPPAQARRCALHVEKCSSCRTRLEALNLEKEQFLDSHPLESLQVKPVHRLRVVPFRAHISRITTLAATLVLLVTGIKTITRQDATIRLKGSTSVKLYGLTADDSLVSRTPPVYHPGERIQFTYTSNDYAAFIFLSMDTSGSVTVYYPTNGDSSVVVTPGSNLPLPNSIELDGYIGDECYLAIFSRNRIAIHTVIEKVQAHFAATRNLDSMNRINLGRGVRCHVHIVSKQPVVTP